MNRVDEGRTVIDAVLLPPNRLPVTPLKYIGLNLGEWLEFLALYKDNYRSCQDTFILVAEENKAVWQEAAITIQYNGSKDTYPDYEWVFRQAEMRSGPVGAQVGLANF